MLTGETVDEDLPAVGPPQSSIVLSWIGKAFLKLNGWRIEGEVPQVSHAVIIANPHTSLWDAIYMLAVAWGMRIRLSWMTKHTVFRWPFRSFLYWVGAIPVDRTGRHDTVEQMKQWIHNQERTLLAIAPSGTRSRRDHWKSGFYHIARAAQVPIVMGFLDYARKCGGVGGMIRPTNNMRADMDQLREFYRDIRGRKPELETTIRLRGESPEIMS